MTKQVDDPAHYQAVLTLLETNELAGLKLAHTHLRTQASFRALFELGLTKADASTIEVWLRYLVPRLKKRWVQHRVQALQDTNPVLAQQVMYWLPKFMEIDK